MTSIARCAISGRYGAAVRVKECERSVIAEALYLAQAAMIVLVLALLLVEEHFVVGTVPA